MPQKAAWTKSAASTKKGAVARSHRVQTRCELGLLKGVLLVVLDRVVRPTRHATDVAKLHAAAPQEGPDLGWAAPNRMPVSGSIVACASATLRGGWARQCASRVDCC